MFTSKDERVSGTLQRLHANGFWMVLAVTVIYVVVMSAFVKAPYEVYEFAIYLVAAMLLYVTLMPVLVGLIEKDMTPLKTVFLSSASCGLVVGVLVTINNMMNYADHYQKEQLHMLVPVFIISTISAMLITLFIIVPIVLLNNWRQNDIERQLDNSEF